MTKRNKIRDFEFVTDGYLSKEYLIKIVQRKGLSYKYDDRFKSLFVFDDKDDISKEYISCISVL